MWYFSKCTKKSDSVAYIHCCLVAKSCLALCCLMNCSTPGFPVFHYLLEFVPIHVHWVSDAIKPSHPLLPPSAFAFNLSQHHGIKYDNKQCDKNKNHSKLFTRSVNITFFQMRRPRLREAQTPAQVLLAAEGRAGIPSSLCATDQKCWQGRALIRMVTNSVPGYKGSLSCASPLGSRE